MAKSKTNILKKIDIFGLSIQLNYKQDTTLKTEFGGVMTILLVLASFGMFYLFGIEIILKNKPFQRYSKVFRPNSEIKVKDFPIAIHVTDLSGMDMMAKYNVSKLMTFKVTSFSVNPTNASDGQVFSTGSTIYENLTVTECNKTKHFYDYREEFENAALPNKNVYCINTDNETLLYNDIYTANSSAIAIEISKCDSAVSDCESDELINSLLGFFSFRVFYVNTVINLENFENPVSTQINNLFTFSTINGFRINIISVKRTEFSRDDGLIIDDSQSTFYNQVDSISNNAYPKMAGSDLFTIFHITTPRVGDFYSRSYTKLTEVLGYMGGTLNILYIIGSQLCRYLSETSFYIQQAKDMVNFKDINEEDLGEVVDPDKEIIPRNYSNELYISKHHTANRINLNELNLLEERNREEIMRKEVNEDEENQQQDRLGINKPQSNIQKFQEVTERNTEVNIITLNSRSIENTLLRKKSEGNNKSAQSPKGSSIVPVKKVSKSKFEKTLQVLAGVDDPNKQTFTSFSKAELGLCSYLKTLFICKKDTKTKVIEFIYDSTIKYFKNQLDIRNVIKTKLNIDLIKFIVFSNSQEALDLFLNFKIPLKKIVIDEEKKLNDTFLPLSDVGNDQFENDSTKQTAIKKFLYEMRENLSSKKLFEKSSF